MSRVWAIRRSDEKTERATSLGRRPREKIGKGNQMSALRFQTGTVGLPSGS